MKMEFRALITAACFIGTLYPVCDPKANASTPSVAEVLENGRPRNLFRLTFERQQGACDAVLQELNAPTQPDPNRSDYFGTLTRTESNVAWSLHSNTAGLKALYVEETTVDIFNSGVSHLVFRVHGSLGGREFDALFVDPDTTDGNSAKALGRIAPNGEFDDAFAVPSANVQDYYAIANAGLAENRGLLRFDIIKVDGITYIVEGSFYEFASFDAVLIYRGSPDREFSLVCSLDPQTTIPPQP